MGILKPDLIMKSVIPVVMAGVVGIYGLIIAVIIGTKSISTDFFSDNVVTAPENGRLPKYALFTAFAHLGAGLTGGLSGLAAGFCCLIFDVTAQGWQSVS
jgi:V-type H+-transporting ATPase 16kDa proteolipid subunit